MPDVLDPYAILELPPGTPKAQVKAQFRRLAKNVHPDRNGSDAVSQERQRLINAAYEFLSDPVRKADYDAYLARQAFPEAAERTSMPINPVSRPSRAVPLFFVLTVLICVTVLVVCVVSQQTQGFSDPVPTVSIVDPMGPSVNSAEGPSFVSPPAEAMPASSGPDLWPASSVPREQQGNPGSFAPAGTILNPPPAWPARDTGPFPSQ